MPYRIELARSALKDFKKLSKSIITQIYADIESLSQNPRPHGYKKLKSKDDLYRIRSGDYRIIYTIHDKILLVLVLKLGHRREIYK